MYRAWTHFRFLLLWSLSSAAAIISGTITLLVIGVISGALITRAIQGLLPASPLLISLAFTIGFGLLSGLVLGLQQKRLMQRHFSGEFRGWLILTVLGSVTGFLLLWGIGVLAAERIDPTRMRLINMQILRTISLMLLSLPFVFISMAQWWILRKYVHGAWLWVVANVTAVAVFFSLLGTLSLTGGFLFFIGGIALVAAAPGIVTGFTLLCLFLLAARFTWPEDF